MSQHDDRPAARPFAAALQWPEAAEEVDGEGTDRGIAKVTAKGEGVFAERIVRLALDRGVKVRTDADLAETLRAAELDREIPYAAFAAVAEILTHLYRANAAGGAREEDPREP